MATYFTLLASRNQPVEAIFAATDVAEENRVRECQAATKIQSVARMRRSRIRYLHVRDCIITMQRTYRSFCGRKRYLDIVQRAVERRQRAVFDHFASVVQRHFRGFYSRKWKSDFYSQKHYLQAVEAKSAQVLATAQMQREQQEVDIAEEAGRIRREKFQETAGGLHHLLSTAVRSGVLRPAMASTGLTTVFGTNIEDDLRDAASQSKRKFKLSVIPPKPVVIGGTAVARMNLSGDAYVRSLQSLAPYDADREAKLLDRAIDAKMASQLHSTAFVTRKQKHAPAPRSLNSESEYCPEGLRR